jgi:hypothetical protein
MTTVDVCFRYGIAPGEREMRGLNAMREVYGIRSLRFNEKLRTVTVEFDASRLDESAVESLLRSAGLDLTERIALV